MRFYLLRSLYLKLAKNAVSVLCVPNFHIFGLVKYLSIFRAGAKMISMRKFTTLHNLLATVEKYKVRGGGKKRRKEAEGRGGRGRREKKEGEGRKMRREEERGGREEKGRVCVGLAKLKLCSVPVAVSIEALHYKISI